MRRTAPANALIVAIPLAIFAVLALSAAPGSASTPTVQGDANCDGHVDSEDALTILLQTSGVGASDPGCAEAGGDTDCSGAADDNDALSILEFEIDPVVASTAAGCVPIGDPLVTPVPSSPPPSEPTLTESPTPTPTPSPTPTPTPTPTPVCGVLPDAAGGVSVQSTATPAIHEAAAGTPKPTNYTVTQLPADAHLNKLTSVVPVPGAGDLAVITQESGQVYTVCLDDNSPRQQIADFSSVVRDKYGTNETDEGFLSFVFDPGDPSTIYVNYSYGSGSYPSTPTADAVRNHIARYHIVNGQIDVTTNGILGQTILDSYRPWVWHNVEQMAFGPDGMLYISSGDGGHDPNAGQTLNDLFGAILRIDVHGATPSATPYVIPPDNPFVNMPSAAPEIWAYGLRNAWRISFDSATGKLWLADVGESTYEEVDVGVKGANYGWNVMEGYSCAPPFPTPAPSCTTAPFTTPRAVYDHSQGCAVVGGYVYHGSSMPELDGYYVYGDWCSGKIWALDASSNSSPPILIAQTNLHIVSFATDSNGELLVLNYNRDPDETPPPGQMPGGVYRLTRKP